MNKRSILFLLWCLTLSVTAQIPLATWTSLGPTPFPINASGQINGIGRITKVKFHPTQPHKMYATSASGGVWISNNDGVTWRGTGTDQMPAHNEATICIDFANDSILYLGTGDPNYYSAGFGVWKSKDGGNTWTASNTGMGNKLVDELLMLPDNDSVLIAATNQGIFKTTDAGANWVRKKSIGQFTDMDFKPGSHGRVVYASTVDSLYRSDDYGNTWTNVSPGYYIPGGVGGKGLRIGVTVADTNVVYVGMVANRGTLFKSIDGGHSFTVQKDSFDLSLTGYDINDGGQGDYDFDINVDPLNPNTVYWVSHNVWKSTASGITSSWQKLTSWYAVVHTDMHQVAFDPYAPSRLYDANDGGIWLTTDGGNSWDQRSDGLSCTEISPAASSKVDKNTISIGTQDNGELYRDSIWLTNRGGDWYERMYYDYFNPTTVYYANGNKRIVSGGDQSMNLPFQNDFRSIVFSVSNPDVAFIGKDTVIRTTNLNSSNTSWNILTIFNSRVQGMAISPTDSNKLFVITSDSKLHISSNAMSAAPTFATTATPGNSATNAGILVLDDQPNVVYMYNNNRMFVSQDTGITWQNITYNIPTTANINGMVHDRYTSDQSIFISNNLGVYYKMDTMTRWQSYSQGLPTVAKIQGLDYYNDGSPNSVLRVPYYGRGMWEAAINTTKTILSVNFGADVRYICTNTPIHLHDSTYNNPTAWNWTLAGATPPSSTLQNPTISYSAAGTYSLSLSAANATSIGSKTKTDYIVVYKTDTLPLAEGFESGTFPPADWINYDAGLDTVSWDLGNYGAYNTSAHSMRFDNYYHDATGKIDKMIYGTDFSKFDSVFLYFDVAYQTLQNYSDSLEVTLSNDCGKTFNQIYLKGGNSLATAPHLDSPSAPFQPTAAQWRTESINLNAYKRQSGIILSFNNIPHYGTDLYVDNINIKGVRHVNTEVISIKENGAGTISMYPNPTTGILNIVWSNSPSDRLRLSIYNLLGAKVKNMEIPITNQAAGSTQIDLSDLNNGSYYLKAADTDAELGKIILIK